MTKMDRPEIDRQLEAMATQAKQLIDTGEDAASFGFGIAEAVAKMGGENPEHAVYCLNKGKERIKEIVEYGRSATKK
jgi:hypothetical protein